MSADHRPPTQDGRLRYSGDEDPGIRRRGKTRFRYVDETGAPIRDRRTLQRIRGLAVPPAWTEVWICRDPRGHLQATGRDARGRKQYRYHPAWRRQRERDKYERMLRLAHRLPRVRDAVEADLSEPGLRKDKVVALAIRVLELTHLRVGNDEYARLNRSYGLTTLRERQASVDGSEIRFRFRGKGGKLHDISVRDRRLARVIRRVQDLPGQRLFEYVDESGEVHAIHSEDINGYLRKVSGVDISAKDLRTWAGTVLAFRALRGEEVPDRPTAARSGARRAIERVAERLGNTAAVARSSYVDPTLLEAWRDGAVRRVRMAPDHDPDAAGPPTPAEEAALLRLLERWHAEGGRSATR